MCRYPVLVSIWKTPEHFLFAQCFSMNWLLQNETGCYTFPRDKNSSEPFCNRYEFIWTILLLIYPNSVSASDSQRRRDHIAENRVFFHLLHKHGRLHRFLATDLKNLSKHLLPEKHQHWQGQGAGDPGSVWAPSAEPARSPAGSRRLHPPGMPRLPEGTGRGHRAHPDPASPPYPATPSAPRGRRSRRPQHLPAPGRGKGQPRFPLTLRHAGCGRDPSGRTVRSTTAPSSSPSHPAGNSSCSLPAGSGRPGRREGRPRTPGNKGPAQPHGCAGAGDARPERRHRPWHRHHRRHQPAPCRDRPNRAKSRPEPGFPRGPGRWGQLTVARVLKEGKYSRVPVGRMKKHRQ